jgi:alpha-1,3-glucan synthase
MQKGVDIIADVFFSVLKDNPKTQLICVGPVIDLYGKFAALKLEKLMTRFPGRVYSKPEFTALPPFIFSGAEFTLIPSRDEPFGLVAVEFGRKGALGVGSKVGGLGQMPGWWYTVESLTSQHLIHQFKQAIRNALASDKATRAGMRARALVQRFPVHQWVEDLDKLQSDSIRVNHQQRDRGTISQTILRTFSPTVSGHSTPTMPSRAQTPGNRSPAFEVASRSLASTPLNSSAEDLPRLTNAHGLQSQPRSPLPVSSRDQPPLRVGSRTWFRNASTRPDLTCQTTSENISHGNDDSDSAFGSFRGSRQNSSNSSMQSSPSATPRNSSWNMRLFGRASANPSSPLTVRPVAPNDGNVTDAANKASNRFSYNSIVSKKKDYELQKVDVIFTDSQNEFYNNFARKLDKIDVKSSEGRLCIEEFLTRSEKAWFGRFHRAKLGMDPDNALPTTLPGLFRWLKSRFQKLRQGLDAEISAPNTSEARQSDQGSIDDGEFLLGRQYEPPSGMKKVLQKKIGDWQLYCFLLAFVSNFPLFLVSTVLCHADYTQGQIIAANSYQMTLLTGEYGRAADKLYVIAAIYMVATLVWWFLYRRVKAVYVVSLPFAVYGLAFFVLGMGLYAPTTAGAQWVFNVATGLYAVASASGSLYFVLNFGTEGKLTHLDNT